MSVYIDKCAQIKKLKEIIDMLNNVVLVGRVVRQPELIQTQEGKKVSTVKDEGRGIPKEKANCIFERFEQVQSKNRMEKQGSGIGLYLVFLFLHLLQ